MSRLAQEYTPHSIFRHQTIFVEAIYNIANSQITKSRDYLYNNHYNFKFFNSSIIIGLFQHIMSGVIMKLALIVACKGALGALRRGVLIR